MYLLAAAGLILIDFVYSWLVGTGWFEASITSDLLMCGYYVLLLGVPVLALGTRRENSLESLRLMPISPGRALLIVILAGCVLMFVNTASLFFYALVEATGGVIYDTSMALPKDTAGIVRMFLLIAVLPGIFEELLFRGAMLTAWEARGGKYAVIVTTLLFAFLHGSVLGLPSELIAGSVMALLALRLGSLYASMIFHTAYNGIAFGLMLYARDLPAQTGTILEQAGGSIVGLLMAVPQLAFYGLLALMLYRVCVRGAFPVLPRPAQREKMDWQALLVLISALITCAYPFLMDVFLIYGG